MSTARPNSILFALGLAFAVGATSCGAIAENVGETVAEKVVEADTGEDVDIDFSGDGDSGSFSIETEDGTVEFNADEDGGTITIDGEDGEDGMMAFGSDAEVPDCVESVLSLPGGLDPQSTMSGDGFCMFTAVVSGGASIDELADRYEAEIAAAGYTEGTSRSSSSVDGMTQTTVAGSDADGGYLTITIAEYDDFSFADGETGEATVLSITIA